MAEFGVVVVVVENERVLLTKREDFHVWCLPGGAIEPNESVDEAAVREVFEETGLRVQLTHAVGLLSKPRWSGNGTHLLIFAARPLTTALRPDPAEVQAVEFFSLERLPEPLLWEHAHLITAARSGETGYVWVNRAQTPPQFANRSELYAWRDQSNVSRQAAYEQLMQAIGPQTLDVILGPISHINVVDGLG